MKPLKFRAWVLSENKMYYRAYQRFLYVVLCEDDKGANDGKGEPLKRAPYDECDLMEGTGFLDKTGKEIFEGDIVRVFYKGEPFTSLVEYVPDMFGSKNVHPLESVLLKKGIKGYPQNLEVEILGNKYEQQTLLKDVTI